MDFCGGNKDETFHHTCARRIQPQGVVKYPAVGVNLPHHYLHQMLSKRPQNSSQNLYVKYLRDWEGNWDEKQICSHSSVILRILMISLKFTFLVTISRIRKSGGRKFSANLLIKFCHLIKLFWKILLPPRVLLFGLKVLKKLFLLKFYWMKKWAILENLPHLLQQEEWNH